MKIALISTPFFGVPPAGYSGLEQVVWDLACALTELGHKVVIFAPGNKNPPKGFMYKTSEPINKVEVNWLEEERKMWEVYKDKLSDLDIVHSSTWYHFSYLSKGEIPELKVCATHHGHLNFRTKPQGVDKMNLIAISRFMAEEYKSILKTDVRFVYNGINLEKYPFKKEKGDRLLYVGRFSAFKQPHIAVEVAKRLNTGLDLCGGTFIHPQDKPYLENLKDMCDGQQIKMHPDAPHKVKVELMQNAKCLLFPSRMMEPFGLVACEAMACGCPVVSTNDGAIGEVVQDGLTGYVCDVYSSRIEGNRVIYDIKRDPAEAMAEAVKKMDSIRPEECRHRVEENFSRQIMGKNYLALYDQILAGEEW